MGKEKKESKAHYQIIMNRWVFKHNTNSAGNRKRNCRQRLRPRWRRKIREAKLKIKETQKGPKVSWLHFLYILTLFSDRKYDQSHSHTNCMKWAHTQKQDNWFLSKKKEALKERNQTMVTLNCQVSLLWAGIFTAPGINAGCFSSQIGWFAAASFFNN